VLLSCGAWKNEVLGQVSFSSTIAFSIDASAASMNLTSNSTATNKLRSSFQRTLATGLSLNSDEVYE
jgi:hypothetical protein